MPHRVLAVATTTSSKPWAKKARYRPIREELGAGLRLLKHPTRWDFILAEIADQNLVVDTASLSSSWLTSAAPTTEAALGAGTGSNSLT